MSHADLRNKSLHWHRFSPVFEKLPIWASYFFAILCSVGMGYSLGSAGSGLLNARPDQITLLALTAGALLVIFLLDLRRRHQERRRAERAEELRLSRETMASQLLDPVDDEVIEALDRLATAKGVDRATLIPAILKQYIARKSYEKAPPERAAPGRGKLTASPPETSGEWVKTVPAWLETLPGSLDVKGVPTRY